jgi:hypothetical protein
VALATATAPPVQRPIAPLGLTRDAKHVYSWNDGTVIVPRIPSVTKALAAIDKPAIVAWAKREVAACAVRNHDLVGTLIATGGPQAGVEFLKRIPDYKSDTAKDLGTRIHALAEAVGRGESVELTDEERPFVEGFRQFVADRKPLIELSEAMVCNLTVGYAGTLDLIVKLDGKRWLLDIKTSAEAKGPYAETGLQLAGYAKAEFIGKPGDTTKYKLPPCSRFGVLALSPVGYRLVEYGVTAATWRAFRAAHALSLWLDGQAKSIVMEAPRA